MDFGNILLAALGIGLLIFVHELGHYLAARAIGVRVEVFSLGFGPRVAGFRSGSTDFRLALIPFGGFVMVAGQDPEDDRFPRHERLASKTVAQRSLFWSAGVVMNVLFAVVAFPLVFAAGLDVTAPVLGQVEAGSPAWEAGLQPGDRVLEVAGRTVRSFENLAIDIALHGGRPLAVKVRDRDGGERVVSILPRYDELRGQYAIGVAPAPDAEPATLSVAEGSAAAAAGLHDGDRLLAIGGQSAVGIVPNSVFAPLLDGGADAIALRVERAGAPLEMVLQPRVGPRRAPPRIGVRPLPRIVDGVRAADPIAKALGLQRGDRVLAIDGRPFLDGDLAIALAGDGLLRLHVVRAGREQMLEHPASRAERAALATAIVLRGDDVPVLLPAADAPALRAGLRAGDLVQTIDDRPIADFEAMRAIVEGAGERSLRLRIARVASGVAAPFARGGDDLPFTETVDLVVAPQVLPIRETGLGIQSMELRERVQADGFAAACGLGMRASLDLVKQIYLTLKKMVTGDVGTKNLGGIVRISQFSYQAAKRGWIGLLHLLAMLSLNLAIVNLLPIPVLDGGHLLFATIEAVKGSPVNARVFGYSQVVGLVFVLMLVLFVTYNDILQLL